jgi:hypothetical protein
MDLVVLVSNILDKLNILCSNMSVPRSTYQTPPPPISATTPMDINAVSASIGFTFSAYQALYVKNKLCQQCLKAYDSVHQTNCSCPNTEVQMKEKLDFFSKHSKASGPSIGINHLDLAPVDVLATDESWDNMAFSSFTDLMMHGCDVDGIPINKGKSPISVLHLSLLTLPPLLLLPLLV